MGKDTTPNWPPSSEPILIEPAAKPENEPTPPEQGAGWQPHPTKPNSINP